MNEEISELKRQVAELKTLVIEGVMIPQGQQIGRLFQNHFGHQLNGLVALSFIVEKCGVSIDDIEKRFADVRKTMGDQYATQHIDVMVAVVLNALKTAYSDPTAAKPAPAWRPQVIDGGA